MEVWETNEYELLHSPLAGELKMEDITQPTNYLEWINWDQKLGEKADIPASNSSDSGMSSDFHYDQQLSPCKLHILSPPFLKLKLTNWFICQQTNWTVQHPPAVQSALALITALLTLTMLAVRKLCVLLHQAQIF